MKPVGIFGGTFDPVHFGHLITAQAVIEKRNLEKIIFIPASLSPHKLHKRSSSSAQRLQMLRTAVNGIRFFEVSDMEIKTGGISYTVDTLRRLKEQYAELELIMGYDNLLKFHMWKDPDEIIKLAQIVVLRREGFPEIEKNKYFSAAVFIDTPVIEISSSDIRDRARQNLPLNFLVPEKVLEYIKTFNLYK